MSTLFGNMHGGAAGKDEWLTPPEIIHSLGAFDLDPCAPVRRVFETAREYYTIEDDGLSQQWHGRVFCNPPDGAPAKNSGGAPSCLVAYGAPNVISISKSGLGGKLLKITK